MTNRWLAGPIMTILALLPACGDGSVEPPSPPANRAPVAADSIPAIQLTVNDSTTIDVSPFFEDPDGDALSFEAATANSDVATASVAENLVTIRGHRGGTTTLSVTATDPDRLFATLVTALEVIDLPPEAVGAIPPQEIKELRSVTLDPRPYFRDPEGGVLNYAAMVSDSSLATVAVTDSTLSVTGVSAGVVSVTVTATDVGQLSATQEFELTVDSLTNREVLEAIYHAMDGPQWTRSENWLTDEPLSRWEGVSLDGGGRVRLSLPNNNLSGVIPPELGYLSSLRTLYLYGNRITGIPATIARLSGLESLELGNNWLAGAIPPELGNLESLQNLGLGQNRLTGGIPAELFELAHLRLLALYRNRLAGAIPPELANLTSLVGLYLSDNEFSGPIPGELANLANLSSLSLQENDLTGPIPAALGGLARLSSLSLSINKLTGPIPPELADLTNLRSLHLFDNKLTGPIPASLAGLTHLRWLYLDQNEFSGPIPAELGNLDSLLALNVSGNDLTGPVPPEFGRLEALTLLDLTGNAGMSGALPGSLTTLGQIVELFTGGTGLCAPHDAEFQRWLAGIERSRVAQCSDGSTSRAYLTQAVQSLDFPVPLVAGEEALLRVFVTAEDAGSVNIPPVRATLYLDGSEARVLDIPQGTRPIPSEVIEGDEEASANANIPAGLVQPGLELVIEIDPEATLDPALGVTRRIPETGRMGIEVGVMPTLQFTLVPFLYRAAPDSSILDLTREMAAEPAEHELLGMARTLLPVREMDIQLHEPVLTSSNHAATVVRDVFAIRAMEGSGGQYMGMMSGPVTGGIDASDYWLDSGFSMSESASVAHVVGHFLGLQHAPCGEVAVYSIDSRFPAEDGSTGAWGYDFHNGGQLVPPDRADLMSGCDPKWVSDYNFSRALRNRLAAGDAGVRSTTTSVESLLLWGGASAEGDPYLEPAFVIEAPPALPRSAGAYEIRGRNSAGETLFALNFDLEQTDGGPAGAGFAFLLPVNPKWAGDLDSIVLSGPGGESVLDGDTDRPMTILRDWRTGTIRGILRDQPGTEWGRDTSAAMARAYPGLEVLTSRGIPN